ncbi:hypothetical protein KAI04_01390 [Candidatus Pacearchaeota archaeon]|nr:hypothetical protein [Candidatus Pacearchaeota archaeon]
MSEIIHVKLEYNEALQSKKDILSSEIGLLKVAKAIKKHQILRSDELKIKLRLHRKLKELKTNITKLQQVLPKVKIPEILEGKRESPEEQIIKPKIEKRAHDSGLESQLAEIQARLKELG